MTFDEVNIDGDDADIIAAELWRKFGTSSIYLSGRIRPSYHGAETRYGQKC